MNIKIQGGGSGTYANTGSCTGVTTYLQHEDLERMKNGQEVQPFFNNSRDYISAQEVTFKIDNNKAKLSRSDAKFYVITVSPSSRELEKMGKTEKEQAEAMRKYVRDDVMQHYAEGFGKGLNKEDIEYYGKIHFERKGADRYDMHAHMIAAVYFHTDFIYRKVDSLRFDALARSTVVLHVPQPWGNVHLATELFNLAVHRDTAH